MFRISRPVVLGLLMAAWLSGVSPESARAEQQRPEFSRDASVADVQFHVHRTLAGGPSNAADCQRAMALALKRRAEYIEANSVPIIDDRGYPVIDEFGNIVYGEK